MASTRHFNALIVFLIVIIVGVAEAAVNPPGLSKPSSARCMTKKYKMCYNLEHVCPHLCPNSCTVECVSCKPICSGGSTPPPTSTYPPSSGQVPYPQLPPSGHAYPPPPTTPPKSPPPPPTPTPPTPTPPSSPPPPPPTPPTPTPPSSPPPPTPAPPTPTPPSSPPPPTPTPPTPTPPSSPPPPTPTPPTPTPPSSPPPPTPTPPTPTPPSSPPPPTPSPPTPTPPSSPPPPTPTPPTPTPPSSPPPPTPTPPTPTPPSSPPPSTPSTPPTPQATAKCTNKNYTHCYNIEHLCPSSCLDGCQVDCVTCKPVCSCDRPGAVCQDPRFIGGDGLTFYFHGKKDQDFCLVSDPNLHINAHFIGKRNVNMRRDFTWVQSIAILFGKHQLFIGALKTSTWDDFVDRLSLSFNGNPINIAEKEGNSWIYSRSSPTISITRASNTNNVVIEVEGLFMITAKVVPITEEESRIHNYDITKDDSFAHLDLGFKFYALSDQVNGVLGQTYRPGYVSRANMGVKMPVLGGNKEFATSSLFVADCAVSQFNDKIGFDGEGSNSSQMELSGLKCESGIGGQGIICKR